MTERAGSIGKWAFITIAVVVVSVVVWGVGTFNRLVSLEQSTDAQWAQVENTYQRRADLIPNLVRTVRGAATFERETLTAVVEARSRVTQISSGSRASEDPAAMQRYQAAQDELSTALGRLMVVVERYPELHATAAFRDLQSQLEGTENRITVERMRFNERARDFNTARSTFPANVVVGLFAGRFRERAYFRAESGAQRPPTVEL